MNRAARSCSNHCLVHLKAKVEQRYVQAITRGSRGRPSLVQPSVALIVHVSGRPSSDSYCVSCSCTFGNSGSRVGACIIRCLRWMLASFLCGPFHGSTPSSR
jgi:hypothetical protein